MQSKYSIKDLERISGIKAHTLRIWEQRYELLNPERTDTNIRYYNNKDLKKILNVSLLNHHGHRISTIARLTEDALLQEANRLLNSFTKESDQVENLVLSLLDWDERKFEQTIKNSIEHFGFESTMEKVVFSFLRQLGAMWQVGIINPAQEHFISNLIRQKIIVEIDKLSIPEQSSGAKIALFFLPANEFHEMALLYANYLCRKRGYRCLYLGQSLPIEDLEKVYTITKPDILVTVLTACFSETELNDYLAACAKSFSKSQIFLSGRLVVGEHAPAIKLAPNFTLFKEFSDFKTLI